MNQCSEVREDLISTFDACLAQTNPRVDIVKFFMELTHQHILNLLGQYWEMHAINLNPYETLMLIDWAFTYNNQLKQFGCRDDALYNGLITLCNTYASKIHSTLIPMILNILKRESDSEI